MLVVVNAVRESDPDVNDPLEHVVTAMLFPNFISELVIVEVVEVAFTVKEDKHVVNRLFR